VRVEIHVRPGSDRPGVGGGHGGALVVRVRQRAERGEATAAALRCLAEALDVPPRTVTLVAGATNRRKVVEVAVTGADQDRCAVRVAELLGDSPPTRR
jgi:uncharacterized protein YggU (UPF0235/DUF167 family)